MINVKWYNTQKEDFSYAYVYAVTDAAEIFSSLITNAPNITIQRLVTHIETPFADKMSGEITLFGVVVDRLRPIKTELADRDYIIAIKAYQERLPVLCTGDLIKENDIFLLKNSHNLQLDNTSQ